MKSKLTVRVSQLLVFTLLVSGFNISAAPQNPNGPMAKCQEAAEKAHKTPDGADAATRAANQKALATALSNCIQGDGNCDDMSSAECDLAYTYPEASAHYSGKYEIGRAHV